MSEREDVQLGARYRLGETILMLTAKFGEAEFAKAVLEDGRDCRLNACNCYGETAFLLAAPFVDVRRVLENAGAKYGRDGLGQRINIRQAIVRNMGIVPHYNNAAALDRDSILLDYNSKQGEAAPAQQEAVVTLSEADLPVSDTPSVPVKPIDVKITVKNRRKFTPRG